MPPQTLALVEERLPPCLARLTIEYFCPANPSYRDYARYGVNEMCEGPRHNEFFLGACEGDNPVIAVIQLQAGTVDVLAGSRLVYEHNSKEVARALMNTGLRHVELTWTLNDLVQPHPSHVPRMLYSACRGGRRSVVQRLLGGLERSELARARSIAIEAGHIDMALELIRIVGWKRPSLDEYVHVYNTGDSRLIATLPPDRDYSIDRFYSACQTGRLGEAPATPSQLDLGLMYACRGGHVEVVRDLLSRGAIIQERHVEAACERGYLDVVELLMGHAPHSSEGLRGACAGGYQHLIDKMIAAGANPSDCRNCNGNFHTPPKIESPRYS
jgi:hypothetical protein